MIATERGTVQCVRAWLAAGWLAGWPPMVHAAYAHWLARTRPVCRGKKWRGEHTENCFSLLWLLSTCSGGTVLGLGWTVFSILFFSTAKRSSPAAPCGCVHAGTAAVIATATATATAYSTVSRLKADAVLQCFSGTHHSDRDKATLISLQKHSDTLFVAIHHDRQQAHNKPFLSS